MPRLGKAPQSAAMLSTQSAQPLEFARVANLLCKLEFCFAEPPPAGVDSGRGRLG